MKIKIDKNGHLHIERSGQMKVMECPYPGFLFCGDSCPMFNDSLPELEICGTIYTAEIIDERSKA